MATAKEITAKEYVYKNIRNALIDKMDNPFYGVDQDASVYNLLKESNDVTFAQEFTKVSGKFVYCESVDDLGKKLKYICFENKLQNIFCFEDDLKQLLDEYEIAVCDDKTKILEVNTSISYCECLVARLGSVVVSSKQISGRRLIALPETHIIVAFTWQLVEDLKDALAFLKEKYQKKLPSSITFITGPSRTADIEKTLVLGAHGPKELFVFLVEANDK
jgi:L-lactate dehydrogenase complex protein LldG